jgi:hypothetical protein
MIWAENEETLAAHWPSLIRITPRSVELEPVSHPASLACRLSRRIASMAGASAVAVLPVATPAAPRRGGAGPCSCLAPGGSSFYRRMNCRRDSPSAVAPTRRRVVARLSGRDPGEAGTDAGVGQILKVPLHSLVNIQQQQPLWL